MQIAGYSNSRRPGKNEQQTSNSPSLRSAPAPSPPSKLSSLDKLGINMAYAGKYTVCTGFKRLPVAPRPLVGFARGFSGTQSQPACERAPGCDCAGLRDMASVARLGNSGVPDATCDEAQAIA